MSKNFRAREDGGKSVIGIVAIIGGSLARGDSYVVNDPASLALALDLANDNGTWKAYVDINNEAGPRVAREIRL